jgi:hypothetical protein
METTDDLELEADLMDRLKIDPMALDHEFITCASNIAYLGAKHGHALREHLRAKIRTKKLQALLLIQARDDLEGRREELQDEENALALKEKRKAKDVKLSITESTVEANARQMPQWVDTEEAEIEAEVAASIAKTNLTASLAKRDMLVQMGANVRAEMERDPTIRLHKRHHRSQEGDDEIG